MEINDADAAAVVAEMKSTLGDLIDSIAALTRAEASLTAFKAELVEQARKWELLIEASTVEDSDRGWNAEVRARRVFSSELACALRIPERSAQSLVADSEALHSLPATFEALQKGEISWRHATTMLDQVRSLPEPAHAEFENAALPFARNLTVAQFDRKARALRERLHPESIVERHKAAREDREVSLQPANDTMAWLAMYLPIVEAQGAYNRLTDMALKQQSKDETRTLAQLRADLAMELLVDGRLHSGRDGGVRAKVLVTVPVLGMLGESDEPATLEGYGPIPIDVALTLAANAPGFVRLLTHPETGAVLSVGRDRYGTPADLRTWLRVRDGTCRFPGCSRAARICEVDHTTDWQYDGQTAHDNLAHLCPMHHRLKHQTGWSVKQLGGGVIEWTSPSGRSYTTEPATRMDAAVRFAKSA